MEWSHAQCERCDPRPHANCAAGAVSACVCACESACVCVREHAANGGEGAVREMCAVRGRGPGGEPCVEALRHDDDRMRVGVCVCQSECCGLWSNGAARRGLLEGVRTHLIQLISLLKREYGI